MNLLFNYFMNSIYLKNFLWKFFKKLANLNFSLFILSLIIVFCILGSVLEQEQDKLYYVVNYPKYISLIVFLGLDHLFRTWWFIACIIVLVASLISCSLTTQLPSLKNARRWKFIYSNKKLIHGDYNIDDSLNINYSFINIVYSLIRLDFFVFSRNCSIYSYKGLYGRIAPIFVHCSIIAVLLGSVYGFLFSFVVQEVIPIGESFHLKNLVYSGFYSNLPFDLFGRVDDFYIKYNDNLSVKQFFSKLSIYLNNKTASNAKLIYVNSPLNIKQISFYQTNWEINGLRIRVGNNYYFQKNLFKQISNRESIWVSNFYITDQQELFFILMNLDNKILVCNNSGLILKEVYLKEQFYINSVPYNIERIISSTGLQIKFDPGIPLVYFGFFVMIITTFMSYLSYSQIWIYQKSYILEFAGCTNRGTLSFEQDVSLLQKIYISYSFFTLEEPSKKIYILR
uniref:Cytochrome c biogenesis protein CcsB n=1 Tax=Vertebrata lanosa TaxID=1261582 RepID=A0A0B5VQX0_9FLOR|nr:cytochrome c biogenesis protein Ccs1 [Vertebrata lanosa]AJH66032.1 cytochrome c biogenesis protein Ccs1 [Vertebrata lanosa]